MERMKIMYNSTAETVQQLIATKRGVLFDLDGTMIPSLDLWSMVDVEYARDCVIFEDSPAGIDEAFATGIDTVAVYDEFWAGQVNEIQKMTPYRINSFEELGQ